MRRVRSRGEGEAMRTETEIRARIKQLKAALKVLEDVDENCTFPTRMMMESLIDELQLIVNTTPPKMKEGTR